MDERCKRLYVRHIDTEAAGKCFLLVSWGDDAEQHGFDVRLFAPRLNATYIGEGRR